MGRTRVQRSAATEKSRQGIMIEVRSVGSMFDCGADALVNPVNCVGVMGKGLALEFRKRFPLMGREFTTKCMKHEIRLGEVSVWKNPAPEPEVQYVINFPTKQHWRDFSRTEWIAEGLLDLRTKVEEISPKCMAMPALGCGLGHLAFHRVLPLIEDVLSPITTSIIVFEPR
jgi:O-acetyl-ADP-ribose deacetylase (regulator of RNase III)